MNQTHLQCQQRLHEILRDMLPSFQEGISEYDIITQLKAPPHALFNSEALSDSLVLFQTHFILFHTLYKLRGEWRSQKVGELDILSTNVKLGPLLEYYKKNLATSEPLADYYLDWENINTTEKSDVDSLLDDFWETMLKQGFQESTSNNSNSQYSTVFSKEDIEEAMEIFEFDLANNFPDTKLNIDNLSINDVKSQYRKLQHRYHPDKGGSVAKAQSISRAYQIICRSLSR